MAGKNAQTQKNVAKSAKTAETPQVLPLEKKAAEMKEKFGVSKIYYCNGLWLMNEKEAKEVSRSGFAFYVF